MLQPIPPPPLGGRVHLDFPTLSAAADRSGRYVVTDLEGLDTITTRPIVGSAPSVRAGTPVLVAYAIEGRRMQVGAIVINCGPGGAVMQLCTADQRRFPRYRRPIAISIEVPRTDLDPIKGLTEDVSLGGVRANVPIAIPVDRRAFVALSVAASDPILMMGRTLSCAPVAARSSYVVRLQFTIVSARDQARLFAFLDWPVLEPTAVPVASDPELVSTP